jgi:hypothetical protein
VSSLDGFYLLSLVGLGHRQLPSLSLSHSRTYSVGISLELQNLCGQMLY